MTFVASEYENGDVWLRLGDPYGSLLFAPTETIDIEGNRRQLLIPILDPVDLATAMLPNSSYIMNNGDFDLNENEYEVKKQKAYEWVEKGHKRSDTGVLIYLCTG